MTDTPDLFGHSPAQGDLFAGIEPPKRTWARVNPDDVRRELLAMLAAARATQEGLPWPYETMRLNRVIFPQMANWLPQEEREELVRAFRAELVRLDLAI
jgi:hypothetical protein